MFQLSRHLRVKETPAGFRQAGCSGVQRLPRPGEAIAALGCCTHDVICLPWWFHKASNPSLMYMVRARLGLNFEEVFEASHRPAEAAQRRPHLCCDESNRSASGSSATRLPKFRCPVDIAADTRSSKVSWPRSIINTVLGNRAASEARRAQAAQVTLPVLNTSIVACLVTCMPMLTTRRMLPLANGRHPFIEAWRTSKKAAHAWPGRRQPNPGQANWHVNVIMLPFPQLLRCMRARLKAMHLPRFSSVVSISAPFLPLTFTVKIDWDVAITRFHKSTAHYNNKPNNNNNNNNNKVSPASPRPVELAWKPRAALNPSQPRTSSS